MSVALALEGPAGRLEALLDAPVGTTARAGAVVAHPHPLRGGTLHNTVVYRTAKALASAGFEVVRFNFRGVGASAGRHDEGRGEVDDVRAALDELAHRGRTPLVAAGYSFGSVAALKAGLADVRVVALAALGLPLKIRELEFLRGCRKPLVVVQGSEDEFGPAAEVETALRGEPRIQVVPIEGSGHFFQGQEARAGEEVARFLAARIAGSDT
ncbi:MAG TPA: alpha/beta fold hydrolase [Planctomycetota bacterium]|nr:alpha/beta fold hydrolase [Planctomycetota bacterium]